MAAYTGFVTHVTSRLTAKNQDQLRNPTLVIEYGLPFNAVHRRHLCYCAALVASCPAWMRTPRLDVTFVKKLARRAVLIIAVRDTRTDTIFTSFYSVVSHTHARTHARTPVQRFFSGTTRVSRYQKGKTNLDLTEAKDSEWQWHQLGHMQVCTSLHTDNHASTSLLSFYRPDALPAAQPTASKHW